MENPRKKRKTANKESDLLQWLELLVDDPSIPGVRWENKDERKFYICWDNYNKKTQERNSTNVFYLYAEKRGILDRNPTVWKHNLRSALDSLEKKGYGIQFIQKKSDCRYYKFGIPRLRSKTSSCSDQSSQEDSCSPQSDWNTSTDEELPEDLDSINMPDLVNGKMLQNLHEYEYTNLESFLSCNSGNNEGPPDEQSETSNVQPGSQAASPNQMSTQDPDGFWLLVFYCGKLADKHKVRRCVNISSDKSKISHLDFRDDEEISGKMQKIIGDQNAEKLIFPKFTMNDIPDNFSETESKDQLFERAEKTLGNMTRGLQIKCINGNIEALRLCKTGVICKGHATEWKDIRMDRPKNDQKHLPNIHLFNYHQFVLDLIKYQLDKTEVSHPPLVHFGIGGKLSIKTLIRVTVISMEACDVLRQFQSDPRIKLDQFLPAEYAESCSTLTSKTDTLDMLEGDFKSLARIADPAHN